MNRWAALWLALGIYHAIAAVGGSTYAAFLALACGFLAGLAASTAPQRK